MEVVLRCLQVLSWALQGPCLVVGWAVGPVEVVAGPSSVPLHLGPTQVVAVASPAGAALVDPALVSDYQHCQWAPSHR